MFLRRRGRTPPGVRPIGRSGDVLNGRQQAGAYLPGGGAPRSTTSGSGGPRGIIPGYAGYAQEYPCCVRSGGVTAPGEEGRKRRRDRKNIDWAGGAVVDMPHPRSRRRDEYGYFLRSGRRSYCFCRKKTPRRDRCLVYRAPFAASLFLFIFFPLAFLCSVKCSRYTYVLCDPCDPEML